MQQDFSDAEREQDQGWWQGFQLFTQKVSNIPKSREKSPPMCPSPSHSNYQYFVNFFKETYFRLLILSAQTGKHENTSYIFVSFDLSIDMYVCTRDARQIVFFTEGGVKSLKASRGAVLRLYCADESFGAQVWHSYPSLTCCSSLSLTERH